MNVDEDSEPAAVAASGPEMTQNSMRLNWTSTEVDARLKIIMKTIHRSCLEAAAQYIVPGNHAKGANSAGSIKVVDAMMDQGLL